MLGKFGIGKAARYLFRRLVMAEVDGRDEPAPPHRLHHRGYAFEIVAVGGDQYFVPACRVAQLENPQIFLQIEIVFKPFIMTGRVEYVARLAKQFFGVADRRAFVADRELWFLFKHYEKFSSK